MSSSDNYRVVYSSEAGRMPKEKQGGGTKSAASPADGTVRLQRQTKGRGGGTVIVISGITLAAAELKELAGLLKKRCGCGGTVKDGIIEIQGDHRDLLAKELETRGYRVKLAGG